MRVPSRTGNKESENQTRLPENAKTHQLDEAPTLRAQEPVQPVQPVTILSADPNQDVTHPSQSTLAIPRTSQPVPPVPVADFNLIAEPAGAADALLRIEGSDQKDAGPWYSCKIHGGCFTESLGELGQHLAAFHSGTRP